MLSCMASQSPTVRRGAGLRSNRERVAWPGALALALVLLVAARAAEVYPFPWMALLLPAAALLLWYRARFLP